MSPLTVLAPSVFEVHEPGSLEHSIATRKPGEKSLLAVGRWTPDEGDFQGMPVVGRRRAELYAEALNTAELAYIDEIGEAVRAGPEVAPSGDIAEDALTGFKGQIVGICHYLTGCDQALLVPRTKEDGSYVEGRWFDVERVSYIEDGPKLPHDRTAEGKGGGPSTETPPTR